MNGSVEVIIPKMGNFSARVGKRNCFKPLFYSVVGDSHQEIAILRIAAQNTIGSRFVERIMTVVSTLKQQDRNVLDYLAEACKGANQGQSAPSLLPAEPIPVG